MEIDILSDHGQHTGGQLVLRGEEARLHGGAKDHRDRTLHAGETQSSYQLCEGSSIMDARFEGKEGAPKIRHSKGGCVFRTKCGQGKG